MFGVIDPKQVGQQTVKLLSSFPFLGLLLNVNVRKSLTATKEKLSKPFRPSTIEETAELAPDWNTSDSLKIEIRSDDDGICLSEDASTDDMTVESGDEDIKSSPRGKGLGWSHLKVYCD